MKLFHLISILLAIAAIANTQILGLIAVIEIVIQIIEDEQIIATLVGEAEFVLTAEEIEGEEAIYINTQLRSGWATLYEGETNDELANYEIQGMLGDASEDVPIGQVSPVSTLITWDQGVPIAGEEWSVGFDTQWTGNAHVYTDGSFILADAGLEDFGAVIIGDGSEGIETEVQWDMQLLTQYEEFEAGGGNSP